MNRYDVIVIGSGVGGMTSALTCARAGRSVLVLEAAKQFGGFCNPFSRKKFSFDSGIHYIGEMGPGQGLRRQFEKLDIYDAIGFRELNPAGFDRYVFPDYEVRLCKGVDRFRDILVKDFPHEIVGIDKFLQLVRDTDALLGHIARAKDVASALKILPYAPTLWRYRNATFSQILDDCVADIRLRAVLAGPGGDVGLPPGKVSGFLMLGVLSHFLGGAYFPKDGTKGVRDAYVDALKRHGATLKRNTPVANIIVEAGKAVGVRTEAGDTYRAPVIISNVDAAQTLGTMLGEPHLSRRLRRKVDSTTQSIASLCVFIGTDMQPEDHGIDDGNIWSFPSYDIDALYAPALKGRMSTQAPLFLTVPSLKDPGGAHAPDGKHTVELITFTSYEPFKKWENQKVLRRDDDYMAYKQELGQALIERAEQFLPGLGGRMEVCEVSTPLTNKSFVNVPDGAIYGPAQTPRQFGLGRYSPKGPVEGLFLCGSSILAGNISSCVASGVQAGKLALKAPRPATFSVPRFSKLSWGTK